MKQTTSLFYHLEPKIMAEIHTYETKNLALLATSYLESKQGSTNFLDQLVAHVCLICGHLQSTNLLFKLFEQVVRNPRYVTESNQILTAIMKRQDTFKARQIYSLLMSLKVSSIGSQD